MVRNRERHRSLSYLRSVLEKKVFPLVDGKRPVFFILIDNLRYDQWKTIAPVLSDYYRVVSEELVYEHTPHGNTVQPQCNILRTDAGEDPRDHARPVGR